MLKIAKECIAFLSTVHDDFCIYEGLAALG